MSEKKEYTAESIKVLEGLEGVREKFDVVELSKKIKRQGDILILSKELKIKPRSLQLAINEGRILNILPNIQKSKAAILARLRTDREVKLFSKKYDFNNTSPKKLIKLVKSWNQNIQKNPSMLLTQEEHDLIIGSLLGDASMRQRDKNSCFRVSHSIKQKDYINFKLNILNQFVISEFIERERLIKNRKIKMIHLSTRTHPVFNYHRNLFYKSNKKTITKELLDNLNPRSLAIWICDDGIYSVKQGYIILCTNSYGLEEHNLMKEFFNKKFGIDPSIGFRDGKYYYLIFKQDDTKKLIEVIRPFIPKFMLYKIGGNKS